MNQDEANRLTILSNECPMLNLIQRVGFSCDVELQVFPDVVSPQSRGVIANAARWVLSQDSLDRDGVVGVDPKRELRGSGILLRWIAARKMVQIVVQQSNVVLRALPSPVVDLSIGIDVPGKERVPGRMRDVIERNSVNCLAAEQNNLGTMDSGYREKCEGEGDEIPFHDHDPPFSCLMSQVRAGRGWQVRETFSLLRWPAASLLVRGFRETVDVG